MFFFQIFDVLVLQVLLRNIAFQLIIIELKFLLFYISSCSIMNSLGFHNLSSFANKKYMKLKIRFQEHTDLEMICILRARFSNLIH